MPTISFLHLNQIVREGDTQGIALPHNLIFVIYIIRRNYFVFSAQGFFMKYSKSTEAPTRTPSSAPVLAEKSSS